MRYHVDERERSDDPLELNSERHRVRPVVLLVAAVAMALGWTAPPVLADGADARRVDVETAIGAAADTTITVEFLNYGYSPDPIRVRRGDTLRLVNVTQMPHNAVFSEVPDGARLESKEIGPYLTQKGDTYEFVIDEGFVPGTYEIYCTPHKALGMTGKIIVESAPAASAGGGGGNPGGSGGR